MTAPKKKTTRKTARRASGARARTRTRRAATRIAVPTSFAELGEMGESAVETGRSVWLAGLGLGVSVAESAGEAFDALVARGRKQEPKTMAAARRVVKDARRTAGDLADEAARVSKRKIDEALDALGVESNPRPKNLLHRLGDLAEAIL
ncbi:MAG TPA: phasin family protein [Thermoanaerobaculia bacterium]|nr:phasin family protein [Thermoanaerobaculia bacterium]